MHSQRPQRLFAGIVLVSLAAHGLVLQLPWRDRSATESEPSIKSTRKSTSTEATEKRDQAIDITSLPKIAGTQPKLQIAPPTQLATQPPSQSPKIKTPSEPLAPQIVQVQAPPIQAPIIQPEPTLPKPSQPVDPQLKAPTPQPLAETPDPIQQPVSTEPEHGMVVQLSDRFPHFQNSESGCFGLENCHRIAGEGTHRQAAKKLIKQMQANGFQVDKRDDIDGQGHQVYEIVLPDEPNATYYLNVFSDSLESTVYAVTLEIVSLTQLQQLSGQALL